MTAEELEDVLAKIQRAPAKYVTGSFDPDYAAGYEARGDVIKAFRELEGELEDAIKGSGVVELHDPGPLEAVEKRNDELESMVFSLGTLLGEVLEFGRAAPSQKRDWLDRLQRILDADGDWKDVERVQMAAKILGPLTRECGIRVSLTAIEPGRRVPGWGDLPSLGRTKHGEYHLTETGALQDTCDVWTEDGVEISAQQPRRKA